MDPKPLISIVMPFLNAGKFIQEAINSVVGQSYDAWELLAADDGSTDNSPEIVMEYAHSYPEQIRYLAHEGHQHQGASASRNLAIRHAKGDYIAMLDADDVFFPHQVEQQAAIAASHPEAAVIYGNTEYWYSWTGKAGDIGRDYCPDLKVLDGTLFAPPTLLTLLLQQKATVPCVCSMLVRRQTAQEVGGFEETFHYIFTDQVFLAKLCLHAPVLARHECWGRYRQHSDSCVASVEKSGTSRSAHLNYLNWLKGYLTSQGVTDRELRRAFREALRRHRNPTVFQKVSARARLAGRRFLGRMNHVRRLALGQTTGTITVEPNPARAQDDAGATVVSLSWSSEGAEALEVHVDAPDGTLFSRTASSGSDQTGMWVKDGMRFYLQDASAGNPLSALNTLATVEIRVMPPKERPLDSERKIEIDSEREMPGSEWYDSALSTAGMEKFLEGHYRLRNSVLANWIAALGTQRVFEFAAGGSGLAKLLEDKVEYLWSDFASVPVEAARKLLQKATIQKIDICKEYENIPWGYYDTVVCVSIEHLANDLEILSSVRSGTHVFLSCATFTDPSHVRYFPTEDSVRQRFEAILDIQRLQRVTDKILLHGIRREWRYSPQVLTKLFTTNYYEYLNEGTEMYRFIGTQLHGRVLDVGCWDGILVPSLNCSGYVGFDLCKEAIERARQRHPGEFIVSDWRDFDYPGEFDSIYFGSVLFYQADKTAFVRRFERFNPRRIVIQDLEETRVDLPYRLFTSRPFYLGVNKPENIRRRMVYVYDR